MNDSKVVFGVSKTYCCVPQCNNGAWKDKNLSFHQFPRVNEKWPREKQEKSSRIRKEWIRLLRMGKAVTKTMRVCSSHFQKSDFVASGNMKIKRLKTDTVPTLNLPLTSLEDKETILKDKKIKQEKEEHYGITQNNRNSMADSKSSKDNQSSSEDMCVIASLYVASDDVKSNVTHVENRDQPLAKQTYPRSVGKGYGGKEEKKAIERTINEYLKKRYLIDNLEEDRNVQNSTSQTKNFNSSVMSQQSHKENCASNKQISLEIYQKEIPGHLTEHLKKSQLHEPSQLPIKIEENLLETDADCDMFAARIAEELKRMKNPCCRAKAHFNIERILGEAKCDAYDV